MNKIAIFLVLLSPLAAPAQPTADFEAGRIAFMSAGCYECHGTVGQGGVGPKLAPAPMPLAAMDAFVRYSSRNMPPYSAEILSDDQLTSIHLYLSSISDLASKKKLR